MFTTRPDPFDYGVPALHHGIDTPAIPHHSDKPGPVGTGHGIVVFSGVPTFAVPPSTRRSHIRDRDTDSRDFHSCRQGDADFKVSDRVGGGVALLSEADIYVAPPQPTATA